MADADEDTLTTSSSSPTAQPDPDSLDLSDETQDFRFLSALSSSTTDQKLPKRGEKDFEPHLTDLQASTLAASRAAMHAALAHPRVHRPANHVRALYDPAANLASVASPRGKSFADMGDAKGGRMWLLPEEMLFLLERGSLDVRWPAGGAWEAGEEAEERGVPMSLQGGYAACFGGLGRLGGGLTLERYTVFAGLKRSGFTVRRADGWDGVGTVKEREVGVGDESTAGVLDLFGQLWSRLFAREPPVERLRWGPLVTPGLYRSYNDIYRLLHIIPFHNPTLPPTLSSTASDPSNPFHVTYHVWKPNSAYKKSNPGPPNYYICVVNARETSLPTLPQLNDLLATTPFDPPKKDGQLYGRLKHGYRNVILAVVDQGIPSFINFADAGFGLERLHERKMGGGPGGKRGGFGGRGRGRGRGQGRGRR